MHYDRAMTSVTTMVEAGGRWRPVALLTAGEGQTYRDNKTHILGKWLLPTPRPIHRGNIKIHLDVGRFIFLLLAVKHDTFTSQ